MLAIDAALRVDAQRVAATYSRYLQQEAVRQGLSGDLLTSVVISAAEVEQAQGGAPALAFLQRKAAASDNLLLQARYLQLELRRSLPAQRSLLSARARNAWQRIDGRELTWVRRRQDLGCNP